MTVLDETQLDRAQGALLGTAAGDALGAPYEFQPPRSRDQAVEMCGGGSLRWAPGEWTDDTSMAVAIAEVASVADLRDPDAQTRIVQRWRGWATEAPDVGIQTRQVLGALTERSSGADCAEAARRTHERTGRSGGNGSLMRTAPVALAYLHDEDALIDAAGALSRLTHFDPEAGEACILWCLAIRRAVLTGEVDVRTGLGQLERGRAQVWAQRLEVAEAAAPSDFPHNGWVVEALQAAWSAIATGPQDLPGALEAAVRTGNDTDTVAAIAGGLVGAAYGASAVPAAWRALLHGWPGLRADGLVDLATAIVANGAAAAT